MHNLWLPIGVCDDIDRITKTFVWGCLYNHWVNWNIITQHRNRGGLGMSTMKEMNVSILGKQVWSFLHDPKKLWVELLANK